LFDFLIFIITISIIVFVHESGHFMAARFFGVKVDDFAIGFGKKLFVKKLGSTEFSIRAIPLGGFVRFSQSKKSNDLLLFENQSLYKKFIIVAAGPLINFIFAFILLIFINSGVQPKIASVVTDFSSKINTETFEIQRNDLIIGLNGNEINSVSDFNKYFGLLENESLVLDVLRGNEKVTIIMDSASISKSNEPILQNSIYFFPSQGKSVLITNVQINSTASKGGLMSGDLILAANGSEIYSIEEFVSVIKKNPNREIEIFVERGDVELMIRVTPEINVNSYTKDGFIGVELSSKLYYKKNKYIKYIKNNSLETLNDSIYTFKTIIYKIGKALIDIFTGNFDFKMLSGPITIAQYSADSILQGLLPYMFMLVLLNINVGLINLLPIPTLDGGHLLQYLIEFIIRKPIKDNIIIACQRLGVIFLLLIMAIAVYNDVFKLLDA